MSKEQKKQALESERIRNSIEGKFGQAKRRFSLGKFMTKLSQTFETTIAISFLVMNLSTWLWRLFLYFLHQCMSNALFSTSMINQNYTLGNRT